MQDETQNPGTEAAPEPNNAPDPGAANPAGEAEGLNQDAAAPDVAPDSAAASAPTDQGSAFDPSVTMRAEDLTGPASPTDPDPNPLRTGLEGSWDASDPNSPFYTGSDLGGDDSVDPDPGFWDRYTSDTEVVSEPTFPEAVSMPIDMIVDPIPTDQVQPPESEAAAPPPLNLADLIDPNWPVLEELNSRELLEVQEVLGNPSKLSDPDVLEDLSSDQVQAVMQALVGHLSTLQTSVVGDPEDGGEVAEPSVVEGPGVMEEMPYVSPDPEAGGESAQLPNLTDQIDPDSPLLNELSSHELEKVQDLLEDPSKLSDAEVLEDLSPDQMQAVMQALVGHLSTLQTSVVGDPEAGGEDQDGTETQDDQLLTDLDDLPGYDDDSDGDGVRNLDDLDWNPFDRDGDGIEDYKVLDSDGDGIVDVKEDNDGDGIVDVQDVDVGNDGIEDWTVLDSDGDGVYDPQDSDFDGDGIEDGRVDSDGDGMLDWDFNNNGIEDSDEPLDSTFFDDVSSW